MSTPLNGCEAQDFIKVETPEEDKYAHPDDSNWSYEQEYIQPVPAVYGEI